MNAGDDVPEIENDLLPAGSFYTSPVFPVFVGFRRRKAGLKRQTRTAAQFSKSEAFINRFLIILRPFYVRSCQSGGCVLHTGCD